VFCVTQWQKISVIKGRLENNLVLINIEHFDISVASPFRRLGASCVSGVFKGGKSGTFQVGAKGREEA